MPQESYKIIFAFYRIISQELPNSVYRGTTKSRIDDNLGGNTIFPPNWTDDPLQAASYAVSYSLGDSHNNVPVILVTEYGENFTEGGSGVPNYLHSIPDTEDRKPKWYEFNEIQSAFDAEKARDAALEEFDMNNFKEFEDRFLSECTPEQRNAVREGFEKYTSFETYHKLKD